MKLTNREKDVLTRAVNILVDKLSPKGIYLFGSRAKEEAECGADFDLALDIKKPDFSKEVEIKNLLDSVSGLYSVDVVFLESVDKKFRGLVLKNGRLIYEKGRGVILD